MRHKWKCDVCGVTGWAIGWEEPDVNAAGLDDRYPIEDACEHVGTGGSYTIVDTEYDGDDE